MGRLFESEIVKVSLSALVSLVVLAEAEANDWTISGTILTPDKVISDGAIAISGQTITVVGAGSSSLPPGSSAVKTTGIILPGFIDLHNHLTWNILPRWLPSRKFANRYEWQDTPEYDRLLVAPHSMALNVAACEAEIYAEIKALIGGATSVVGSLLPSVDHPENKACSAGLVRNLDVSSDLPFTPPVAGDPCEPADASKFQQLLDVVDNEVFPMEVQHDRLDFIRCVLKSGVLRSLVVHLSEGAPTDASANREFSMLDKAGLLMPGLVIIHGTALRAQDFNRMHETQVGLVWSPRSNDELYGATSNIAAAQQASVPIAIAPDWSPSGSAGMLQELSYVGRRYKFLTAQQVIPMATTIPAKISRLDQYVGSLAPGMLADVVVIRGSGANPYQAVLQATPADILLVVVGGQPLYGDPDLLTQLLPGTSLEPITVCGANKLIYLGQSAAGARGESFADIRNKLDAALEKSGSHLASIDCD